MSRKIDVLVIGSGMAGLVAALAAAREGAGVRLLCAGVGSLGISSGIVDLLGYAEGRAVDDPWAAMSRLPPEHPYALLGVERVRAALDFFAETAAAQGWPMRPGPEGRNTRVPTVMGTLKPTWLVPGDMDAAALASARRVLVCSVEGLRDCRPGLIVSQLRRYAAWADRQLDSLLIPSPLGEAHRGLSALDLARAADRDPAWLAEALRSHAGGCDLLLLPPICGSHAGHAVWDAVREAAGCPVAEMLGIPPGVGGLRLREVLLGALRWQDFELVENATALRAETAGARCVAVTAAASGGERRHEARAVVLATGGILGGGIALTPGRAREAVFGLDIPMPEDVEAWSEKDVFGNHRFSRLGLRVDACMRPVDAAGTPLLKNVFVAGRACGGYDYAAEKSGHGVAIATGWMAGRKAAQAAQGGGEA